MKVHYYSIRHGRVCSIIRYLYVIMKGFEYVGVSTRVNNLTNQLLSSAYLTTCCNLLFLHLDSLMIIHTSL